MTKNAPTVSVVIPVYNGERYVSEAIDSMLAQTFPDFELILIDDGSTDGSLGILRSYPDPRVRVECNDRNLGLAPTHNRGLALARGRYVAMLDHDDWSYPDRLAEQVAFLDRHDDHVLVGGWAEVIDAEGRTTRRRKRYPVSADEVRVGLLFRCCVFHPSIMARTEAMREHRYTEGFSISDDFDLFVRLAGTYRMANLPKVLVRHRRHESRTSERKAHLKKGENLTIFRAQLTEMGMPFDEADLERHYLLGQMRTLGFRPDAPYLDWADKWLGLLQAANRRTARYPEPALSRTLRETWFKVCWHAFGSLGWAAWKHYYDSPLSKGVWSLIGGSLASTCLPVRGKA